MIDETKELITAIRHNELEFPSEVAITYSNVDNDYQIGTEYARRITAKHENIITINLPIALTPAEAAKVAEIALNSAWYAGRFSYSFATNYSQLILSPGDLVSLPLSTGNTEVAKITSVDYGPTGMLSYEAIPDLYSIYSSNATGAVGITYEAQSVAGSGPTKMELLDCCMLRDEDTTFGWYSALSGYSSGWPGGTVLKSSDGGATWTQVSASTSSQVASIGITSTLLSNADCRVWDKANTVTVKIFSGNALYSATEVNVLNGANAALIGGHGRWELIQWLTATLNGDGSYTLSNLLRGRKGTEWAASLHTATDSFIALSSSAVKNITVVSSELNATKQFKAVTSGQPIEGVTATDYTYTGVRLKPLAPVLLGGSSPYSGTFEIKWSRRDRVSKPWVSLTDLPMSETEEQYEIDVYNSTYTTYYGKATSSTTSATINALSLGKELTVAQVTTSQVTNMQLFSDEYIWRIFTSYAVGVWGSTDWIFTTVDTSGTYNQATYTWADRYSSSYLPLFPLKSGLTYNTGFSTPTTGWEVYTTSILKDYYSQCMYINDVREDPTHIFVLVGKAGSLNFTSNGTTGGQKTITTTEIGVYSIPISGIVSGTITPVYTTINSFFGGNSTLLDSATTWNPVDITLTNTIETELENTISTEFPVRSIAFGSLLYVVYKGQDATMSTSGKTLDITNIFTSHVTIATSLCWRTAVFSISGGTLTPVKDIKGFVKSDAITSTTGVEFEGTTRRIINSSTGATISTATSIGYTVIAVAGDRLNNQFYTVDTFGIIRKHDSSGTVMASYTTNKFPINFLGANLYVTTLFVYIQYEVTSSPLYIYRINKNLGDYSIVNFGDVITNSFMIGGVGSTSAFVYPAYQLGVSYSTSTINAKPNSNLFYFKPTLQYALGGTNITISPKVPVLADSTPTVTLPSSIGVRVYQMSTLVGRGYPLQGII